MGYCRSKHTASIELHNGSLYLAAPTAPPRFLHSASAPVLTFVTCWKHMQHEMNPCRPAATGDGLTQESLIDIDPLPSKQARCLQATVLSVQEALLSMLSWLRMLGFAHISCM